MPLCVQYLGQLLVLIFSLALSTAIILNHSFALGLATAFFLGGGCLALGLARALAFTGQSHSALALRGFLPFPALALMRSTACSSCQVFRLGAFGQVGHGFAMLEVRAEAATQNGNGFIIAG